MPHKIIVHTYDPSNTLIRREEIAVDDEDTAQAMTDVIHSPPFQMAKLIRSQSRKEYAFCLAQDILDEARTAFRSGKLKRARALISRCRKLRIWAGR